MKSKLDLYDIVQIQYNSIIFAKYTYRKVFPNSKIVDIECIVDDEETDYIYSTVNIMTQPGISNVILDFVIDREELNGK